jgi:glycerol-3-phosphate dehydrogenase subunit C
VPGTTLDVIERCSGHNGTYAVKKEFHDTSMKIGRPVMQRVEKAEPAFYASDCPMAGHQIESGIAGDAPPTHPLSLLRLAYGLEAPAMLTPADLLSLEHYARSRKEFRARVLEHKKLRNIAVGPHTTWCFEDRLTVQYQIQEMLRTERIFEPEGIREELDSTIR